MLQSLRISRRVFARGVSTKSIIPPNLAGVSQSVPSAGAKTDATESNSGLDDLVYIYRQLPKGPAPAPKGSISPFTWYYNRYIGGENASSAPIVHLILGLFVFGYSLEYQHLKAHAAHEGH